MNPNHDAQGRFSTGEGGSNAKGDAARGSKAGLAAVKSALKRAPHEQHAGQPSVAPKQTPAERKAAHDAGAGARIARYASEHGGRQAAGASGLAARWQGPPTPRPSSVSHAGKSSVHSGGGGGGGGGGDGGGGGRLSAAARDSIIRKKGIDARHGLLPGAGRGAENQSRARDLGMREPPNSADFAMSALRRRR